MASLPAATRPLPRAEARLHASLSGAGGHIAAWKRGSAATGGVLGAYSTPLCMHSNCVCCDPVYGHLGGWAGGSIACVRGHPAGRAGTAHTACVRNGCLARCGCCGNCAALQAGSCASCRVPPQRRGRAEVPHQHARATTTVTMTLSALPFAAPSRLGAARLNTKAHTIVVQTLDARKRCCWLAKQRVQVLRASKSPAC